MRKIVAAILIGFAMYAGYVGYAWAQETEAEQRSVPLIMGVVPIALPTDIATDGEKAHVTGVYGGVFDIGGGSLPESTGSSSPGRASVLFQILRRGK